MPQTLNPKSLAGTVTGDPISSPLPPGGKSKLSKAETQSFENLGP